MNEQEYKDQMKEKSRLGKLKRTRGHNFEREMANAFKTWTKFKNAKRHLEFQIEEAAQGRDLDNTGPLAVQCKRGRSYSPITKLFEVEKRDDNLPMLVTRADDQPALIAMRLSDFFALLNIAFPETPIDKLDFMQ